MKKTKQKRMKFNYIKEFLTLTLCFFMLNVTAQVTTASMSGDVMNVRYEPKAKLKVLLVHEPTKTVYSTQTDANGSFKLNNIRVGGPYTIKLFENDKMVYKESEIQTNLGEDYYFSANVGDLILLDEVVVAAKKSTSDRIGAETALSRDDLDKLPQVNGGLSDFVRVTPEARITEDNVISVAGQNNRYNAIYIDGAVDNDVFGLASNGQDGGQVGGNPFTFDELAQISVNLAPMDVRQSGFAGGAINATTKTGQNQAFGSLYWFNRNEKFAGKTANYDEKARKDLEPFSADRYGVSLGGALMKDKLFYFMTYEKEKQETPQPFDFANYGGSSKDKIDELVKYLGDKYNYNPGSYGERSKTMDKDVFVSRLDYNFRENQTLTFKYKLANFDSYRAAISGRSINFDDNSEVFKSKKNQFALDWNSKWNNKFSTKVLLTYKTVRDSRTPKSIFPSVQLQDGFSSVNFGADQYSTANSLDQDIMSGIFNATYNVGSHNLLFGVQYDLIDTKNIFIRENFGKYIWKNKEDINKRGIDLFLEGANPSEFSRSFSILDGDTYGANNNNAAAAFKMSSFSSYIQDEWNVARGFDLTAGVRLDIPSYDKTRLNEDFNKEIPKFEKAGYQLKGAKTGMKFNQELHISPRIGFRYRLNQGREYATTFNGGVGVFTSRMPLVWIGGAYNNTGNTLSSVYDRSGKIPFSTDVSTNHGLKARSSRPEINIFSADFKLPQRLKFSIGANQKLPEGYKLNINYQYDKVLNDVFYQNININKYGVLTNDGRTVWSLYNDETNFVSEKFGNVLLGTNTTEGYAYTFSMGLSKTFFNNTFASINYVYNDAFSVNNGTSSQNYSQWRYQPTVNGKNERELYRANYSMGSRVTGRVSTTLDWKLKGAMDTKTIISAFYEGASGSPISYTYYESKNLLNDVYSNTSTLIYVPKDINDINLKEGYQVKLNGKIEKLSKQQQWEALNSFIESDKYLKNRRGQFAERNGSRMPWTDIVDVKVQQEFDFNIRGQKHTLGFSFDIFNFTNLLNKDWGRRYEYRYGTRSIIKVIDVKDDKGQRTATYGVDPSALDEKKLNLFSNSGINSSLWQMQLGVKYSF